MGFLQKAIDYLVGDTVEDLIYEKLETSFLDNDKSEIKPENLSTTHSDENVEKSILTYNPFTGLSYNTNTNFVNNAQLIGQFRQISTLPEVAYAIEMIVDEAIVKDDFNTIIKMIVNDNEENKIPDKIKEEMQKSFDKALTLMEFNESGDKIFTQFYIDGTVIYEDIYDNKKIEKGIIDIVRLSPKNFKEMTYVSSRKTYYTYGKVTTSNLGDKIMTVTAPEPKQEKEQIFKPEQITRAVSGMWDDTKKMYVSYLNMAMKAINQLYSIEDSILIYRLTRSNEKRVFHVDVGKLKHARAEQIVKNYMEKFRQKRIYSSTDGKVINQKKSISLLEDYWFPKTSEGKGTEIEILSGTSADMGELEDLKYFQQKVYQALRVPRTRLEQENELSLGGRQDTTQQEELTFFKFIVKLRNQFANIFYDFLMKDLIAKKVISKKDWIEYKNYISFIWNSNNNYNEIKAMNEWNEKLDMLSAFSDAVEQGYYSKTWIRKNVLKQSDEEIENIQKEIKEENKLNPKYALDTLGNFGDAIEEGYFSKTWVKKNVLMQSDEEIKQMQKEIEAESGEEGRG